MNWVEKLLGLALFLQTIELIQLQPLLLKVWTWPTLRNEFQIFSQPLRSIFDFCLNDHRFVVLLWLRALLSALLMIYSDGSLVLVLFLLSLLISIRFRGAFNGGSDAMTLLILSAVLIANLFPDNTSVTHVCLWYIGLNLTLSYFRAGLVKIKNPTWRNGSVLPRLLSSSIYQKTLLTKTISSVPSLSKSISWILLIFELSFPLALFKPEMALIYSALGFTFHLANVYFFGLNRFFFIWFAAYPALFYCSQSFLLY